MSPYLLLLLKVEAIDVGKVYKIRIGHDGSGIGDGWFLEMVNIKRLTMAMVQVEVKVEPKKDKKKDKKKKKKEEEVKVEYIEELQEVVETLTFPSNRWLARDEVDGEIVAELLAEGTEDLESERMGERGAWWLSKSLNRYHFGPSNPNFSLYFELGLGLSGKNILAWFWQ